MTKPSLVCMDDIEERAISWLWYPYIPYAAAVLMHGPGGVGKSHIVCDWAARISKGLPFPGEKKTNRQPGRVLIMSAEDDADAVLKPNLRLMGADMKKIFVPDNEFVLDGTGLKQMEDFMSTCQATVLFIDPIVAYLGGKVDMFRSNEVRAVMGTINKVARNTGTSIIIVGHDRKNKEGSQQDAASGSADFVNAVRGSFHVVEDKYGKALWHDKSNYGPKGRAISYSFNENVFTWGDYRQEESPVWGQKESTGKQSGKAETFIIEALKDGPLPAKELISLAKDEGINERTLNRAKGSIAESYCNRDTGKLVWYWRLIGQE